MIVVSIELITAAFIRQIWGVNGASLLAPAPFLLLADVMIGNNPSEMLRVAEFVKDEVIGH